MKTCPKCEIEKPPSEFYTTGKGQPSSYCKPCCSTQQKDWWHKNRKRKLDINKKWRVNNEPRMKVIRDSNNKMWKAIREGKFIRSTICSKCDSTKDIEAAHMDYSKPLDVLWLCSKCHRSWDAQKPKSFTKTEKISDDKE